MARDLTITDLAGVVYSSGKVFEGLSTGRLDTEIFLRTGSTEGVSSRADLALLEDLRDLASWVLAHGGQRIGVSTRHGRHLPPPATDASLQRIIDAALSNDDPVEAALELFIQIAKAQPFEDGNKRTALFAANSHLIMADSQTLLVVPVDETGETADRFSDLLARAYMFNDSDGVKALLRREGIVPLI